MINDPERKAEYATRRGDRRAWLDVRRVGHTIKHNLGWKVLALFLAVVLWAGLITQDPTLTRERSFTDVPVNIVGADTLQKNGLIVISGLGSPPPSVRLKVDVPQREYNNVSAANYNVRIDLSRINTSGLQTVKIVGTSSSSYGTVKEISPDTLEVQVDDYITRYRIPVTVVREGDPPVGFYSTASTSDPPWIAISGPASLVNRVSRAVAAFDQSALPAREGLVRPGVPFVLVDSYGNEISSDLIQVTSESVKLDSVVVEQTFYPTKIIDLGQEALTTGEPASGYRVKSVSVVPEKIVAAGREEALQGIDKLFLESPVNIEGATETFTSVLKVRQPAEIEHLSSTSVTVTVEIEPVIANRSFENLRINTVGLGSGLGMQVDKSKASVTISGPKLWLDKLKAADITLTAEVTGLKAGTHSVALMCTVASSEGIAYSYATDPAMVQVTLTEK